MSGLSLRTGVVVGGNYTPLTPASTPPAQSVAASSIAQKAYGVNGAGGPGTGAIPGYGGLISGAIAVALLTWIYFSLPR